MPDKLETKSKTKAEDKEPSPAVRPKPEPKELDRSELESLRRNLQSRFHR